MKLPLFLLVTLIFKVVSSTENIHQSSSTNNGTITVGLFHFPPFTFENQDLDPSNTREQFQKSQKINMFSTFQHWHENNKIIGGRYFFQYRIFI